MSGSRALKTKAMVLVSGLILYLLLTYLSPTTALLYSSLFWRGWESAPSWPRISHQLASCGICWMDHNGNQKTRGREKFPASSSQSCWCFLQQQQDAMIGDSSSGRRRLFLVVPALIEVATLQQIQDWLCLQKCSRQFTLVGSASRTCELWALVINSLWSLSIISFFLFVPPSPILMWALPGLPTACNFLYYFICIWNI